MLNQPLNPNARTASLVADGAAWIAVTRKDVYGVYPVAGSNTYPIIFQSATYTETAGIQTLGKTARSAATRAVAMNLGTGDVPEGTVITVERIGHRNYFYWDA
jgi:hypothetical protein